ISIVFVCRTYDFKNDNNIKSLFSKKEGQTFSWKNIRVGRLSNRSVENVVGKPYHSLTKKLKELLKLPNNLYIWQQLDDVEEMNEIASTNHLVARWWNQLIRNSSVSNIDENQLNKFKENILDTFESTGKLFALSAELDINDSTITYLISSG